MCALVTGVQTCALPILRILPEMWPKTTWPFSSLTRKVALGRFSRTSPCICMTSSFAILLPHWQSRTLEVGLLEQRAVLVRHHVGLSLRSDERRVGKQCVSTL